MKRRQPRVSEMAEAIFEQFKAGWIEAIRRFDGEEEARRCAVVALPFKSMDHKTRGAMVQIARWHRDQVRAACSKFSRAERRATSPARTSKTK